MTRKELTKEIFSWVRALGLAVVVAVFINGKLVANATVTSGSMETTIMTGDRIIGNRLSYLFSDPERGDVITFRYPDNEEEIYLKRIIGLPGEILEIVDGAVYIDGELLAEDYLEVDPIGSFGPYIIPEDSYFVMGDNRNISGDSRYWRNTYVHKSQIIAKAVLDYFPKVHLIN